VTVPPFGTAGRRGLASPRVRSGLGMALLVLVLVLVLVSITLRAWFT
jgi:hypothetical protein